MPTVSEWKFSTNASPLICLPQDVLGAVKDVSMMAVGDLKKLKPIVELSLRHLDEMHLGDAQSFRDMFLDVAAHLRGFSCELALKFWGAEDPRRPPMFRARLNSLVDASLLKVVEGRLEMHDLLQALGRAKIMAGGDVLKRSHLWMPEAEMLLVDQVWRRSCLAHNLT